jgi:hypothetical protein
MILYLLIVSVMILWGLSLIYFSRIYKSELSLIKQRLTELEATQIIISTSANSYDAANRPSRQARLKSKLLNKQKPEEEEEELDSLAGSIYFKVPVGRK